MNARPIAVRSARRISVGALAWVVVASLGWSVPVVGASDGSTGSDRPSAGPTAPTPRSLTATDRVLVRWASGSGSPASSARIAAVQKATGRSQARFIRTTASGAAVYDLGRPLGADGRTILARLDRLASTGSVEADLWMTADALPNDPHASALWGLLGPADASPYGIDVVPAWPTATGSGVVVAVIDTGLVAHPELAGQTVPGYDMITDAGVANDGNGRDADPADPGDGCEPRASTWHGTHVAGTIAAIADNGIGVFGGAPGVRIEPVRVLGKCGGYSSDVADGIRWASGEAVPGIPANANPARVLNLSLSGASATCTSEYASAIASARSRGAVVVVSAGNNATNAAGYAPANCSTAVTVAAIDSNGLRASFSNYGPLVDLAGPGVAILSTVDSGPSTPVSPTYATYNGTSMAAPHVALTAALVAAFQPSLDPDAIEAVLEASTKAFATDTGVKGCPSVCGRGVVNAAQAIDRLTAAEPIVGAVDVAERFPAPGGSVAVSAVAVDTSLLDGAEARFDAGAWTPMSPQDGVFDEVTEHLDGTLLAPATEGDHTVCVRATDTGSNVSDGTACTTLTVDAGPPAVDTPEVTPAEPLIGDAVTVAGSATDGVSVDRGEARLDAGPWLPAEPADEAFGEAVEGMTAEFGAAVAEVSSGFHSCVRLADATVRCWGPNQFGQLGDGTTIDRTRPARVKGLDNVAKVVAGPEHTCALLVDTTVRCWGWNDNGELGDGTTIDRSLPVAVSGLTGVTSLSLGLHLTCALLEDATVRCWGTNFEGEIGDGTRSERHTPTPVLGLTDVTDLAGGSDHTCAIVMGGTVRCWGFNPYGALGDDSTINRDTPVSVVGLSDVVAIDGGTYHTCAVLADATVRCWGGNMWAQLGDGTKVDRHTPVAVGGLEDVAALATGGHNGCVILADGSLRCWGINDDGQVGDGTFTSRPSPVAITSLGSVDAVSVGGGDSCALVANGSVHCWGVNLYGEVGDGTTLRRNSPIAVAGIGALGGGEHEFCLRAIDTAGHTSSGASCATVTVIDPAGPEVTAFETSAGAYTNASTIEFQVAFSEAVSGLTAGDFTGTGTTTGCVINAPTGSGAVYEVIVSGCSQGTLALTLGISSVVDADAHAGPTAQVTTTSILIDRTTPTTTAPTVSLRLGNLAGSAAPATVGWTTADAGGSGITRVELAKSLDGGASWSTVSTTLSGTALNTTLATSGTLRYRVRAIDRAGNTGSWVTGPDLSPRLVQETSTSIVWSGAWVTRSSSLYSGGSIRASWSPGASATMTWSGRAIGLVATKASSRGAVRVYIDGTLVATVDTRSRSTVHRSVIWQATYATSATRTIKLVVVGTASRPGVDFDAFEVIH